MKPLWSIAAAAFFIASPAWSANFRCEMREAGVVAKSCTLDSNLANGNRCDHSFTATLSAICVARPRTNDSEYIACAVGHPETVTAFDAAEVATDDPTKIMTERRGFFASASSIASSVSKLTALAYQEKTGSSLYYISCNRL